MEAYIDRYSIDDAINDGATVPVRYAFGPSELFLDREKLKAGYAEITEDLDEDEKQRVEKTRSAVERVSKVRYAD